MNERHPIDELFRRALHDAEATPPPAVWEGIARKRAKRRGGYWSWLVAALLLGSGTAAWLVFGGQTEQGVHATAHEGTSPVLAPTPGSAAVVGGSSTTPAAVPVATEAGAQGRATPVPAEIPAAKASDTGPTAKTVSPKVTDPAKGYSTNKATDALNESTSVVGVGFAVGGSSGAQVTRDAEAAPLDVLGTLMPSVLTAPVTQDSIRRTAPQLPYVLPNADWWVALEVGRSKERRTWYGENEDLVKALNATEVPHYAWSAGLLAGRSWRNGFGLALGVAYQGSSQSFQFSGPATQEDTVLYLPYLVTLDTEVFVSNVDTVPTYVTVQEQTKATNSFSVVRVSAEGHWHANFRRWTIGPRVGLGSEFTTMRQGLTLDSGSDTLLSVVNVANERYDTRYATVLTGLVGADIGFALTEHWGLWATPTYARGLANWGAGDAPYMLPERLGLRLRLSYTFTRIK